MPFEPPTRYLQNFIQDGAATPGSMTANLQLDKKNNNIIKRNLDKLVLFVHPIMWMDLYFQDYRYGTRISVEIANRLC